MILTKKYLLLIVIILFLTGCDGINNENNYCSLNGIEVTIEATSYTEWIYLAITDTGIIELSMTEEEADTSLNWDLAMMRNHFRTNSGESGPGNGGAFMMENTWTCELFNELNQVPENVIFEPDSILTNIYQPWEHDDPDEAYTEEPGSTVLENWGWFDIDDSYYFYYTHKQFVVKLPNNRFIKIWPYQYYSDLGESAHVTFIYDFIQE